MSPKLFSAILTLVANFKGLLSTKLLTQSCYKLFYLKFLKHVLYKIQIHLVKPQQARSFEKLGYVFYHKIAIFQTAPDRNSTQVGRRQAGSGLGQVRL